MDKEKSRDLTDMSETEIQHAERRHGGDFSGVKSRRTRRRQEKLGLRKTRGEESNETEEELHSMTEPEPLEEQTDGELEEVIKDPYEDENYNDIGGNPQKKKAWEVWLEKKDDFDQKERDNEGRKREAEKEKEKYKLREFTEQEKILTPWRLEPPYLDSDYVGGKKPPTPTDRFENVLLDTMAEDKEDKDPPKGVKKPHSKHKIKPSDKAWESWLKEKDALSGRQSETRKPKGNKATRGGRGISDNTKEGQATDARHLDTPRGSTGTHIRTRIRDVLGDIKDRVSQEGGLGRQPQNTVEPTERSPKSEREWKKESKRGVSRAPRPQGQGVSQRRKPAKGDRAVTRPPEDWAKIDDAVQTARATKLEDRARMGIPYGKALKAWGEWLEKRDDWDKKERELDWRRRQQRTRNPSGDDHALDVHAKEEMQGGYKNPNESKQWKDEEEAVRSGKVAPSRAHTITSQDTLKDPKEEHYVKPHILHENKALWKSWLENKAQQKGFNNQNTGEELDAWYGDLPSDQNDDVGEPTQARADEEFAAQRHEAGRSRGVKDTNVHFEGMHGIKKPRKNQYSESTAEASKAWEEWLKEKNFIFSGRRDRKTGKKKKVKFKEQYNLDDFESEKNVDKINLIYENKILPILGAIARGVGEAATEVGQGVAEGVKDGMTNDEEKEE